MALQRKTLIIISLAIASFLGVVYATSSSVLLASLKKAEEQNTRQTVQGVVSVFSQIQADFSDRFSDWSAWNDSYEFIAEPNKDYIKTNLGAETLANLKVNLILYVDASGRLVYGTGFNLKTNQKTAIPQTLLQRLNPNDPLLQHDNPRRNLTGIFLLPEGPMIITSQPIVTSTGKGPIRGTLIFGRYLNINRIEQLVKLNRLSLSWDNFYKNKSLLEQQKLSSLLQQKSIVIDRINDHFIAGYTIIPDIYGQPALILRVDIPREIYQEGLVSLNYLIVSLIIVGLVFGWVALLLVKRLLLFKQEREELQKINQLKDDFLSTISHELRTPLTNIKMAIQMLGVTFERDEVVTKRKQVQRYLKILQDECAREISLINDLLDLQRLESGNRVLSVETIELQTWLLQLITPFKERISNSQQTLHLDIPPQLPSIVSDRYSLERILAELINNACKYTPPGEQITVSARAKAQMIQFRVKNSGVEIPASELAQIFNKFYRIPGADQWKQGGTGLGLALVQKLVENLGGCIWVESASNQTCFTVELPVKLVI